MPYTAPAAAVTPNQFLHGNNGSFSVTIPSGVKTFMDIEKCEFTYTIETERIDHTGQPGWQVKQNGQQMVNGTITFIYDLVNNPILSPYALTTGSRNVYELNLNAVSTANPITTLNTQLWSGPAVIENLKFAGVGSQAGTQRVTADFSSSGVWTIPTA